MWRSAYESAVARAEALEVEQRRLKEEQEKESVRVAAEDKEQRRKQRRQEEQAEEQRRAAAAAATAAAALPARLAAIRAQYSGAPLLRDAPIGTPEGAGPTSVLDHEVAGVQRRLREHSMELQAEAREIEELRAALDARPDSKPQQPPPPPQQQQPQPQAFDSAAAGAADSVGSYTLRGLAERCGVEDSWWAQYQRKYMLG